MFSGGLVVVLRHWQGLGEGVGTHRMSLGKRKSDERPLGGQCHWITVFHTLWNSPVKETLVWMCSSGHERVYQQQLHPSLCLAPSPSGTLSAASGLKTSPEKTVSPGGQYSEGFPVDVMQATNCEISPLARAGGREHFWLNHKHKCRQCQGYNFCSSVWSVWKPSQQSNRNTSLSTVKVLHGLCFCEWRFFP